MAKNELKRGSPSEVTAGRAANERRKAVVLLSGGLDSATVLAIARGDGFDVAAITFRYGQRHAIEVEAARNIAAAAHGPPDPPPPPPWKGGELGQSEGPESVRCDCGDLGRSDAGKLERHEGGELGRSEGGEVGRSEERELGRSEERELRRSGGGALGRVVEHRVIDIDLRAFGGSALTADIAVPKDRDEAAMGAGIPITYVPARNTIFLSYALAFAEVRGARDIFIGVNAVDYSGYPDCRPDFVAAFERLANLATRAGVGGETIRIHAPLIDMTKPQIIRRGLELGVDYRLTRSCYDPDAAGRACGRCDSCRIRRAAFDALGVADPAPYQAERP